MFCQLANRIMVRYFCGPRFSLHLLVHLFIILIVFIQALVLAASVHASSSLANTLPHMQGTRKIVLEQLEQLLLAEPTLQIIGQGSWMNPVGKAAAKGAPASRAYMDPLLGGTSDHDLRLAIKSNDKFVAQQWKAAQSRLRQGITAQFPKNASSQAIEQTLLKYGFKPAQAKALARQGSETIVNKILNSVNLYPPPQLMRDVVNERTAQAVFKNLGAAPNLGNKWVVEGVWGEGSAVAIQEFEATGRVFYNSGRGGVRAGFVDLVHMSEGYARYSLSGAANLTTQWTEKALEALSQGDKSGAVKYLKRVKDTLNLAAKKANLPPQAMKGTFAQLDNIIAQANKGIMNAQQLRIVLKETGLQASLFKELARNPGPMDRQIIMAILDPKTPSRFGKVGEWFRNQWQHAKGNPVPYMRTLQGLFVVYSVWQVHGTWNEHGMETALRQAGVDIAMFASLPAGAVALLANYMLETAKDTGYNMAIRPQDWQDFLAGISSVKGFEGFSSKELSIEQLAREVSKPEEVVKVVEEQATYISELRETGAAESAAGAEKRKNIRQRLIYRMTPIVLEEWMRTRKEIMIQYLDLALELDDLMEDAIFRTSVQPQPVLAADGATDVRASLQLETTADLAKIHELLQGMQKIIESLGGPKKYIHFYADGEVTWTCAGKTQKRTGQSNLNGLFQPISVTLPGRGSHPVQADFRLKIQVIVSSVEGHCPDVLSATTLLDRDYQQKIPGIVEVMTMARAKVEPVQEAKLSTATEIMAGETFKLKWDRSDLPSFKPGEYKVMLMPSGYKISQEDFHMLAFTPSGSLGGVFKYPVEVLEEKVDKDRIEIEVQVPQVIDIQAPESFDLTFIFMDREASLSGQLDQAFADLEKAQQEMDELERQIETMSEAEQIKFLEELEKQMENALAQAETDSVEPYDPSQDPLPPDTTRSLPVTIYPTEVDFTIAPGWELQQDDRMDRRTATCKQESSEHNNHIQSHGTITVYLSQTYGASRSTPDLDTGERQGQKPKIDSLRVGNLQGQIVRRATVMQVANEISPYDLPASMQNQGDEQYYYHTYSAATEALLTHGLIDAKIRYNVSAQGSLKIEKDEESKPYVVYDSRPLAATLCQTLIEEAEMMLASLRIGKQTINVPAPKPVSATEQEAPQDTYIRLVPAKTIAEPGEFIEVRAVLENPKGDEGTLTYEWSGNHAGKGESVIFFASDPGNYDLGVIVRNAQGLVGSTSVGIQVQ
ncbi:MAG: hypothetical protein RBR42_08965 [Desulfomicrobium sp.]|nr:hypothetical protein [Desulfomicrobium sp.]